MTDSIQSTSSIPIPGHHTVLGSGDPNQPASPRSISEADKKTAQSNSATATANFQDWLNQQQILTLAKQNPNTFDPAAEITRNSPYGSGPGGLP